MIEKNQNEAMVQDQNLTAPQAGVENKEIHENMENSEKNFGEQALGAAIEGEQQAATVPASEVPANVEANSNPESSVEKEDGTTDTPNEEEIAEREARKHETEVYHAEVARVLADTRYHAISLPGGKGVILNLTAAMRDGVELGTPSYNRAHGKDQERTAKSIAEIGLQHPLIVATSAMAEAASMPVVRFSTDPKKDIPFGEHLVVIDGNGRLTSLMAKPVDEWPEIFALFPFTNPAGEMNLRKDYVHININTSMWGGPDFLVLKVMEPDPHEAWLYIKELQKKGYGHTASNVLATLKKGNISKSQLTKVDLDEAKLFDRFEYAKKVHSQMVGIFGETSDVLKTKQIPEEMVDCFNRLVDKGGIDKAVEQMVSFLKSLETGEVSDITNAKGKDGASKHVVRVTKFHSLFENYLSAIK